MSELLLASKRCAECLTTRNRIVPGERAARIIKDCREQRNHFFCHKGGDAKVHCRGVHDILKRSRAHDFALAYGIPVREVDPETTEAHGPAEPRTTPDPEDDDVGMRPLLGPVGSVAAIGHEVTVSTRRPRPDVEIRTMRSPHGSTRYLASIDGNPVSVLQVVSRDGVAASVANVFTARNHRMVGLARMLLDTARSDFARVVHSDMLSEDGRAFAAATDGRTEDGDGHRAASNHDNGKKA